MDDKSVISSHGHKSTGYRYEGNLLVFGIQIIAFFVCHCLLSSTCNFARTIGILLVILTTFFSYTWTRYHASGLTRQKRAHFNEQNVIETYQTRARTEGILFKPDPPTPAPSCCSMPEDMKTELGESNETQSGKISKEDFVKIRDKHYENMFAEAQKAASQAMVPDMNTAQSSDADAEQDKAEKVEDDEDFKALSQAIAEVTKNQNKPSTDDSKKDDEDEKKD